MQHSNDRLALVRRTWVALAVGALVAACSVTQDPVDEPVATTSSALAIAGLFSTGVNALGVPLANGAVDPHYTMTSTDPALPGPNAVAVAPNAAWVGNTATSKWISGQVSTAGATGAVYTYKTTFALPAVSPSALAITGQWACDDSCVLLLNGTQVAQDPTPAWSAAANFTIPGGSPFQTGTNTLAFVVSNTTGGPTGLQVIEMTGGCTADAQCSSSQFCNTATTLCVSKLNNGTPIPIVIGHTPPLTGICTVAVGTSVCASGVCDTTDNECGYANGDGPCTVANGGTVCQSGTCSTNGTCEPSGGCNVDADCGLGNWCDESTHVCTPQLANGTTIPTDPAHMNPTLNGTCTLAAGLLVCQSGVCDTTDNECGYANEDGPCTILNGGTVCRSTVCSTNGTCEPLGGCNVDADCTLGKWCDESTHVCTPQLPNGTTIPTDPAHMNPTLNGMCTVGAGLLVCQSGVCDPGNNECGYANGDGPCTPATGSTVCQSGTCSTNGTCEPSGGCNADTDCTAGNWCDESTHVCTPQLANGTAIPTDPAHMNPTLNGTCTVAAGLLVCQSGVCDTTDNECGYANGDGPCTKITGGTVCRSGACSVDGTCEPSGGCEVDTDCTGGDWCDEAANACKPPLPNGSPIPKDPTHMNPTLNGTCTVGAGALVCASGVCDTTNSECGYANGDGPCTSTTGSTVCQSGACSVNGTCEPKGGCNVNGDCASPGMPTCNPTTHTCQGSADGGADGGANDAGPVNDGGDAGNVGDAGSGDGGIVAESGSEAGVNDAGTGSDGPLSVDSSGEEDAANLTGYAEGGGISCSSSPAPTGPAGALWAIAVGGLALARRKRR